MKKITGKKCISWSKSIFIVLIAAILQTFVLETFVNSAGILSPGFTGLSILARDILKLFSINFPISVGLLLFNIPCIFFCYREISFKFTFLSTIDILAVSLFLNIFKFKPLIDDIMLSSIIGGVLNGFSIVILLTEGASSGGTDFIAIYVSEKFGRAIWSYVFLFNVVLLTIFGVLFGYDKACYSIVFQFVSTKVIDKFHQRYKQLSLQIITGQAEKMVNSYIKNFRHGITVTESYGGYTKRKNYICETVVSTYEVKDIIKLVKKVDPKAVVNVFRTESFYGGFYRKPIE
ncbi:MAG: YitT family protein [Peptoniphilaceae bacterium]|nr:YitT family protein [Peptoniphilaceae bacterium]MDD7383311.1 YitT family protein [Peptoniphilaceae bacterium]MDY3738318.1 YitT family protein [Peptoniphilaceae bacterium]